MSTLVKRAAGAVTRAIADRAVAKVETPEPISIGTPMSRIDGSLKVTGAATYPSDVHLPGMVHADGPRHHLPRRRVAGKAPLARPLGHGRLPLAVQMSAMPPRPSA